MLKSQNPHWTFIDIVKVIGIFLPTKFVWRPFGGFIEVDRCCLDGYLVTNRSESVQQHVGHTMKGPVKISLLEMLLIWVRIIR